MDTKKKDREKKIVRTSLIGIGANLILVAFKALVGFLSHSISVIIDAVNNFSDALSSLITIVGTRLAGRKADRKHPLGHGRIEYFTTLLVAVIILYAGITAFIESLKKVIHPEEADFSAVTLIILACAVIVKLVLGLFVKKVGEQVHSDALKASGADALFDAVLSSSVLLSALLFLLTRFNIEAYVGILISVFIMKSGLEMLRDTVSELIGKRVPRETVEALREEVMKDQAVEGVYDIVLHSYGPDRFVGSVHVSIPDTMTARQIDDMERRIAEDVYDKLGILLTGVGIYVKAHHIP